MRRSNHATLAKRSVNLVRWLNGLDGNHQTTARWDGRVCENAKKGDSSIAGGMRCGVLWFVVELTWRLLSALAPYWFGPNNQHALTSAGLLRGGDELIRLHDPGPERCRHCKLIRRQDPRPRDWCKR